MANFKVISFLFWILTSIYANTTPGANYYGDDRNIRLYENYITQTTSDDSMMSFEEERDKEKESEKENNMDIIVHINPSKNKYRQGYKGLSDYSTTQSTDASTTKIEKKNTKRVLRKRHKTGKKKLRKLNHVTKNVNDEQGIKEKKYRRKYQNEVPYNDNSMSSDQTSEEKSVERYPKNNLKHISVSIPPATHVKSETYPKKYQEASVTVRPPKTKKITKKHKKKSESKSVVHKKFNTNKTNNTEFSVEDQEEMDHMPLDIVVHIKMNEAS